MIGQKDNVPYYTAKTAEERLGEHNKEPKLLIQAAQSKNKPEPDSKGCLLVSRWQI